MVSSCVHSVCVPWVLAGGVNPPFLTFEPSTYDYQLLGSDSWCFPFPFLLGSPLSRLVLPNALILSVLHCRPGALVPLPSHMATPPSATPPTHPGGRRFMEQVSLGWEEGGGGGGRGSGRECGWLC